VQFFTVLEAHVPAPSHSFFITAVAWQAFAPQLVPLGAAVRHAPEPLHSPSPLHGSVSFAHVFFGSAPPACTLPHVPSAPPVRFPTQLLQVPEQAASQHSDSTQKPDWHCSGAVQACAFATAGLHACPSQ
jgi:hypothetical protein